MSPPIRYFYNKRNAFLGMANQRTAPVIEFHEYMVKPDEEQKVWRYLDFTKFLSLLDKNALFFSRIDRLTDKYEGA